jgi:hypothetical protein
LQASRDLAQLYEEPVRLLCASAHARGKDAEVGELALTAPRQLLQAIMLYAQPRQEFLRVLVEALDQAIHIASQRRRAAAAVDSQHD